MYKIMTPGPTQVRENVRLARAKETTNPDIDLTFYDFYKETCELISEILHTNNQSFILSGEGILGLEAACASLTELNDRVLIIDNGIFGKSFADFVKIYGGEAVLYSTDYEREINIDALANYLEKEHNFKYATIVHCDTPSGVINNVEDICPLLKKYGILSVVDSVSAMFGQSLNIDKSQIDIVCGASQKALSAPIGLTFLTVSKAAIEVMKKRKTPIASFYANLLILENYYENKWFPYSMPISDIYALRIALNNIKDDLEIINRHENIAYATRKAIIKAGLSLYLKSGYSNTVTVVKTPEQINVIDILKIMKEKYNILIAGCFDILEGKVFRIGHMGENSNIPDMAETLDALTRTLEELGISLSCNMKDIFLEEILK